MFVNVADRHNDPSCCPGAGGEALIRLNDIPKLPWLPKRRGGSRLAVATLHRWCTRGLKGRRLRIQQVGGTRCTTEQWLREFFDACQPDAGIPVPSAMESEPQRRRRATAAASKLAKEGFESSRSRRLREPLQLGRVGIG